MAIAIAIERNSSPVYENDGNPIVGLWKKYMICATFPTPLKASPLT